MKKLLITLTLILTLCLTAFSLTACKLPNNCKHENKDERTVLEATCTQVGLKRKTCVDCGKILEEETIAKLSHTESDWIIDEDASCKDAGVRHKKCISCNAILEIDKVSDSYTHNYLYGECELCGAIDSTYMTEGLVYMLINNDTEYSVLGYTGSETSVIIPAVYRGKAVTSIDNRAFASGEGVLPLTSIEIPDSITSIGYIGHYSSLTYNIKDGIKYLGNGNNPYIYLADVEDNSITTATIDNGCKFIGNYAFSRCSKLTSVVIPNSVTSIGDSAFNDCDSLTSMVIPDSVTIIGNYAFEYCDSLTIYCEAESKPNGWESYWNDNNCPVVWGYKG